MRSMTSEKVVEGAEGVERQTARPERGGVLWVGGMFLASLATLGVSVGMTRAAELGPRAEWWTLKLERGGLAAGDFLLAGLAGFALTLLGWQLARLSRRWAAVENALGSVQDMELAVASVRTRIGRVHLEVTSLQEANKALLRLAQDQSAVQAAGMQIDATYRLAASMDQLGERLDARLNSHRADLGNLLDELNTSVRAAREQLDLLAMEGADAAPHDAELMPLCDEAILPEPPSDEDLEVEVTLEETNDGEPRIDPSQFDWGAPPDPEDARGEVDPVLEGLSLLDALDSVPSLVEQRAEVEPPAPAPESLLGNALTDEVLQAALENARRRPIQ
ncbi:MAG: hypothetical protein H6828_13290 [Planctomycetes bacterium]|nr:hypothetical protein [Planctomycetota bacterium]